MHDFLIIILENHFLSDIIQFHHARMFGYFTQYYNITIIIIILIAIIM